jgi:cytochrome c556
VPMRFALVAAFFLWLLPQEIADEKAYRERMHEIDHSFSELEKNRDLRHGEAVEKEAAELSGLFERVESFWKGRGNEEAAGLAHMAKEGADAVVKAARKREPKALDAAIATIGSSCEGCHEEPLDRYRFKRR